MLLVKIPVVHLGNLMFNVTSGRSRGGRGRCEGSSPPPGQHLLIIFSGHFTCEQHHAYYLHPPSTSTILDPPLVIGLPLNSVAGSKSFMNIYHIKFI